MRSVNIAVYWPQQVANTFIPPRDSTDGRPSLGNVTTSSTVADLIHKFIDLAANTWTCFVTPEGAAIFGDASDLAAEKPTHGFAIKIGEDIKKLSSFEVNMWALTLWGLHMNSGCIPNDAMSVWLSRVPADFMMVQPMKRSEALPGGQPGAPQLFMKTQCTCGAITTGPVVATADELAAKICADEFLKNSPFRSLFPLPLTQVAPYQFLASLLPIINPNGTLNTRMQDNQVLSSDPNQAERNAIWQLLRDQSRSSACSRRNRRKQRRCRHGCHCCRRRDEQSTSDIAVPKHLSSAVQKATMEASDNGPIVQLHASEPSHQRQRFDQAMNAMTEQAQLNRLARLETAAPPLQPAAAAAHPEKSLDPISADNRQATKQKPSPVSVSAVDAFQEDSEDDSGYESASSDKPNARPSDGFMNVLGL